MRPAERIRAAVAATALAVLLSGVVCALVPSAAAARVPVPVLAYYYIWFNPSSWNRAKTDYPTLGRYSSDERLVMRRHIEWAKAAGIGGFIVSWKSTPLLDRRLERLIRIAEEEHFKLGVIYQGLDFKREPLPVRRVERDLDAFRQRFAASPVFRIFGRKPLIVWSGTWRFDARDIARVTAPLRKDLLILATEKDPSGVRRLGDTVDGDAYYWSSVNPSTFPDYEGKLAEMSATVDRYHGLWIAPAAPGFDARLVGGKTVVPRDNGKVLRREFAAAIGSQPDAVGIISWNEFSENSHVEPSLHFGTRYLNILADLTGTHVRLREDVDSSAPAGRGSPGAGIALIGLSFLTILAGLLSVWRRNRSVQRRHNSWRAP